jgi:hypothetical protein
VKWAFNRQEIREPIKSTLPQGVGIKMPVSISIQVGLSKIRYEEKILHTQPILPKRKNY